MGYLEEKMGRIAARKDKDCRDELAAFLTDPCEDTLEGLKNACNVYLRLFTLLDDLDD